MIVRALITSVVVLAVASTARAQALEAADCPSELVDRVTAALTVELVDAEPEVQAMAGEAALSMRCDAAHVALRVEAPDGRYVGQDVPLELGTPRRAAITLLELLRALVLVAPRTGDVPAAPPSPIAPGPRSTIVLAGQLVLSGDPLLVLGGGAASARLVLDPIVALGISIDAAAGSLEVAPGRIDVWTASVAVSVRFGGRVGDVQLFVGPVIEGAIVSWSGQPAAPGVVGLMAVGPRVSAGLVAAASYVIADPWLLDVELGVEGAFVGSEARFDENVVARTLGPSGWARVGVGWVLP